mmetsp:Transcript_45892/g.147377  ORF Transcript_45892/g.147377 Transcript_45892/m.147377 type:complete len:210 (+) Transcript_45892:32-661(+)
MGSIARADRTATAGFEWIGWLGRRSTRQRCVDMHEGHRAMYSGVETFLHRPRPDPLIGSACGHHRRRLWRPHCCSRVAEERLEVPVVRKMQPVGRLLALSCEWHFSRADRARHLPFGFGQSLPSLVVQLYAKRRVAGIHGGIHCTTRNRILRAVLGRGVPHDARWGWLLQGVLARSRQARCAAVCAWLWSRYGVSGISAKTARGSSARG